MPFSYHSSGRIVGLLGVVVVMIFVVVVIVVVVVVVFVVVVVVVVVVIFVAAELCFMEFVTSALLSNKNLHNRTF